MPTIILDTETTTTTNAKGNIVYNVGFCIVDGTKILETMDIVIAEVFYSDMMKAAYYYDKRESYLEAIASGDVIVLPVIEAWKLINAKIKQYKIKSLYAFNAGFDKNALDSTVRYYSNNFVTDFFPSNMTIKCLWSASGSTICATKKYVRFCLDNGFISEKGNPRTSAEIVYRYLTQNIDFVEEHTALADALIEFAILQAIKSRKQKTCYKPGSQGWRAASEIAKNLG